MRMSWLTMMKRTSRLSCGEWKKLQVSRPFTRPGNGFIRAVARFKSGNTEARQVTARTHKKQGEIEMKVKSLITIAAILTLGTFGFAQDVASDVGKAARVTGQVTEKTAGKTTHGAVSAAKKAARGGEKAAKGTGKAARATAHGTEMAADDTAGATEKAARKARHGVKVGAEDVAHAAKRVTTKTADAVR